MMRTGTNAINVDAIPASVYCTAIKDNETPINGPVRVAPIAAFIPLLSFNAFGKV